MEKKSAPDFSPIAKQYAAFRPRYPDELLAFLASLVHPRHLAWDCATGNGQAALGLVEYFDKVIATDVSAEQIRHATQHPQIEYRVANAEQSGLADHSVDLIVAATAMHWFNIRNFYKEVRRIGRPESVLAAWTYHAGYIEPPFGKILKRFYDEVVSPYFAPGARLVDERYETIRLPGKEIEVPQFWMNTTWNMEQMLGFIRSWSGTQRYIQERGEDPVKLIVGELENLWGDRAKTYTIRWPLFVKVSRL